jgi:hypothetical protein
MRFTIILLIICSLLGLTYEKSRQQCQNDLYRCADRCRKINNPAVRIKCEDECRNTYFSCMRSATN